jgi:hypothetical protein
MPRSWAADLEAAPRARRGLLEEQDDVLALEVAVRLVPACFLALRSAESSRR